MLQLLKEWWPVVAFVLMVLVLPFVKWVVGQLRKGLASHDDLQAVRADAVEKIAAQAKSAADAALALEIRLNNRFDVLSDWVAGHNVTHAQLQGQIEQLRQAIDLLPKAEQITKVLLIAEEMRGDLKAVQQLVDRIDGQVTRHEITFAQAGSRKVSA
jgi:hypothetical protein